MATLHRYARDPFVTDAGKVLLADGRLMADNARNRNKRLPFPPAKGPVVQWSSRGSGVKYEPARGVSKRKFYALKLERVARECAAPFTPGMTLIRKAA